MTTSFADQLREVGLRVTEPRLATLEQIKQGGHVSAEDLRAGVAEKLGSVSTQAIYDIVHALTAKGLLREIKPAGHVSLFELSRNDNHHHLICRSCGRIEDVPARWASHHAFSPPIITASSLTRPKCTSGDSAPTATRPRIRCPLHGQ